MSINDKVFVRVYKHDDLVEVFQSSESQIVIGQEGDVQIKLADPTVSSVHALIEKRQNGFFLCDLGSKNGTFIDGRQILDEKIESGQVFQIGPYRLEFFIGLPKPVSASSKTIQKTPQIKAPPPPPSTPSTPKLEERKVEDTPIFLKEEKKQDKKPTISKMSGFSSSIETHQKYERPTGVKGTFAPESQIKDMSEYIKPTKGSVVEVSVVWKDRIIDTKHFNSKQIVTIGGSPKADIFIAALSNRPLHPLLKIDNQVKILITSDMNGEYTINETRTTINDMILKGKIQREGVGYALTLEQSCVIKVELSSEICVFIRFVSPTPRAIPAPFLLLSSTEFAVLIGVILFFGILGLYFAIYSPETEPEELKQEENLRKAVFIYDRPKQRFQVDEVARSAETTAQPIKDQEKAVSRGEEGKASEAMPNKSQSQVKKLTTPVAGTGKGIARPVTQQKVKPDSGARSQEVDPTKSGMFSAFGSKGLQDQLSRAYTGSGTLGGLAGKATGTGGQAGAGSGNTPGTGLKDIGAGGEGTSTFGIAGVKTQGRGGGNSGFGTAGLGAKSRASIVPGGEGEAFTGTIDREAIRRVIRENLNLIQACYEKALNRQPNLFGRIAVEWVITTNGRVASARIAQSTLKNAEAESCIIARFKTFKFPEPPPDQEAVVTYPFVFNAQ